MFWTFFWGVDKGWRELIRIFLQDNAFLVEGKEREIHSSSSGGAELIQLIHKRRIDQQVVVRNRGSIFVKTVVNEAIVSGKVTYFDRRTHKHVGVDRLIVQAIDIRLSDGAARVNH